jgi:hypothetical protein
MWGEFGARHNFSLKNPQTFLGPLTVATTFVIPCLNIADPSNDGRTPISGLYASGTDCLGVLLTEKKAYVTYGGLAQGWAFTSGKLAGASAAQSAR